MRLAHAEASGWRKHSPPDTERRRHAWSTGVTRSHPGDLTPAVDWMCLWAPRDTLWGLLSPLCQETGGRAGAGIPYCPMGSRASVGERTGRSARCPPQLFAASSPGICCSHSQLFAVQHSSYLQSLPTYLQSYPHGYTSNTPAVQSSQTLPVPTPAVTVTFPAVGSYHLQLSIISLQLFAVTTPVICNFHPPFEHQVRLAQD